MWSWLTVLKDMWRGKSGKIVVLVIAVLLSGCKTKNVVNVASTDAEDYMTCWYNMADHTLQPIIFSHVQKRLTSDECAEYCGDRSTAFTVYYFNKKSYCFCGDDNQADTSCTCPDFLASPDKEPEAEDDVCSDRIYIPSPLPLYLDSLQVSSSRADTTVKIKSVSVASEYQFDFGDGSEVITVSTPSASHAYLQQGVYNTKIKVTTRSGERDIDVGVHVLDPPRLSGLTVPTYIDGTAGKPLTGEVYVQQGTEASVTWERTNPDGTIIQGE